MPVPEVNPSVYLTRGWCQEAFEKVVDGKDCYCFLGAVNKSYQRIHEFELGKSQAEYKTVAYDILNERGRITFPSRNSITEWQDRPERTQQEVIDLALEVEERIGL